MRLVHENWSFCSLKISKMKRLDCSLGPVQLQSFSSLETGPSNTSRVHSTDVIIRTHGYFESIDSMNPQLLSCIQVSQGFLWLVLNLF